jgi:hypothetical protein
MYSEDHLSTPDNSLDSEPIPKLQRRTVHPDSIKFMEMAKDLLDSPTIQQAVESEQQKQKDSN